jgi:hypothetical protein
VVDPAAGRVLDVVDVVDVGTDARVQGVDAGFDGVYAIDQAGGRVVRVDQTGVTADAEVGANPYEVAVGPDRLFVAGRDDGTVTALPPDLSVAEVYDVGGRPSDVALVGGVPWTLDRKRDRLSAVGPGFSPTSGSNVDSTENFVEDATGDQSASIPLPAPAFAGAPTGDGDTLAVTHYDDDRVSLVSTLDRETVWSVGTPSHPFDPLVL